MNLFSGAVGFQNRPPVLAHVRAGAIESVQALVETMYVVPISRVQRVEKSFHVSGKINFIFFGQLIDERAPFGSKLFQSPGHNFLGRGGIRLRGVRRRPPVIERAPVVGVRCIGRERRPGSLFCLERGKQPSRQQDEKTSRQKPPPGSLGIFRWFQFHSSVLWSPPAENLYKL